jgi:hypothetical protein
VEREVYSKVLRRSSTGFASGGRSMPKASQVGTADRFVGKRFADLDQVRRERILLSCARSRSPRKRIAYQSLKTVGLLAYLSAIESTQNWASSGPAIK